MESKFETDVMEKLGRMEAKLDSLVGNGQPGRMKLAEDKLDQLEHNDLRRTWVEHVIAGAIAFIVSTLFALRSYLGIK